MNITSSAQINQAREDFYGILSNHNLGPLWESLSGLVPAEPAPRALPYAWFYDQVRPLLLQAGDLISAEEAVRRVLVLQNPGLPNLSQITDTIYAGLQLILPGEIAPAHRHTQSALRFILEGEGAFTTVNGERTTMHPGDFIITPAWAWHDHGHDGTDPVVWMDGLDLPQVNFLRAGFRAEHEEMAHALNRPEGDALARYGSGMLPVDFKPQATSPVFNYPYARTREALDKVARHGDPDAHLGFALRYVNPTSGDWAIPTIATGMRLLPAGFTTRNYKSTDGAVITLLEGRMTAHVGNQRFDIGPRDIVAVPGWTEHRFEASQDAVFFIYSDQPVHEKLGLWREWRG